MSLNSILAANFILLCDSYKLHHFAEYPDDTQFIYSTVVPRKGSAYTKEIVATGATFVAAELAAVRITQEMIDEAELEVNAYGYEFNRKDWETIVREFDGRLPLDVYGVEEGTVVKPNTPILGIVNTDPRFFWLVSYVETVVQRIMWKMTTVASISRYCYKELEEVTALTGSTKELLEYKLHNFGDRGADGEDGAILAAIAHGTLFSGSDCLSAGRYIKKLYRTSKNYLSSVDATEHSVMCSHSDAKTKDDFGAAEMSVTRLEEAVKRTQRGIGIPLQSVVIDTYDDERFVKEYLGERLKERIVASGGVLVARPDSGDPMTKPIQVIEWLDEKFGSTDNAMGFKTLHPSVRVIQGDGINQDSLVKILDNLVKSGYSLDNLTFGMGGGLTHGPGRDEFSFSMKATARLGGGVWVNLLKEPKTDASKKSLTGLAHTQYDGDDLIVTSDYTVFQSQKGWRRYFSDGFVDYVPKFEEVRARARS
jgi:nicotinamide phosphoribosyltransferase